MSISALQAREGTPAGLKTGAPLPADSADQLLSRGGIGLSALRPFEHLFEFLYRKEKNRRPAVGAVVRVNLFLRLAEKFAHGVAAKFVPFLDRGAAGAAAENFVEEVFRFGVLFSAFHQDAEYFDEDVGGGRFFENGRVSGNEHRVSAERFGDNPEIAERLLIFQRARRLFRREFDRFGNEHLLRVEFSRFLKLCPDLFVEDPFVQRVLVDQRHAGFGFEDEKTVVDLNDRFAVGVRGTSSCGSAVSSREGSAPNGVLPGSPAGPGENAPPKGSRPGPPGGVGVSERTKGRNSGTALSRFEPAENAACGRR